MNVDKNILNKIKLINNRFLRRLPDKIYIRADRIIIIFFPEK